MHSKLLATRPDGLRPYRAFPIMTAAVAARAFDRMQTRVEGQQLLRDRPNLAALLRDDEYLATLPAGSLGHAYRAFAVTAQLPTDDTGPDTDFGYFLRRFTAVHQLLHTLCGYGTDLAGQITAYGFHCGQVQPARALTLSGCVLSVVVPGAPLRHKLRVYRQAVRRGRRADPMPAAPWEELLDRPVGEVRKLLGIAAPMQAHPNGIWFSTIR